MRGRAMNPVTLALAFGNFMVGTGALIVSGMLPALSQGLSVPLTATAQLIPAFALAVCLTAPFLAGLTARFERRALLVTVLLAWSATHALAACVTDLGSLTAVRVLCGIASALYTPQAAATVALLVPAQRRASAMAAVFLGWAAASVLGMPIGAYVGAQWGWRAGFALVALGSLCAALAVYRALPRGLKVEVAGAQMWRQLLANGPLMLAIAITAVQSAGQFVSFGFMVPAFRTMASASPLQVSLILSIYGGMGLIGSLAAGRLADRWGAPRAVALTLWLVIGGMLLWPLGQGSLTWMVIAQLVWGLGGFAINATQQGRLANMAPGLTPVSIALNTSCIYLGQAIGTPIGIAVLEHQGLERGFQWLAPWGVPFMLLAVLMSLAVEGWRRRLAQRPA